MDLDRLRPLLGLEDSDPKVSECLKNLGAAGPPSVKPGDLDGYVEIHKIGLYLVFTKKNAPPGALVLNNVSVYCHETNDGYAAYTGRLSLGLSPSRPRDAVRAALGNPELSIDRPQRKMDRWTLDGAWLYIRYTNDAASIGSMGWQVPDPA